VVKFPNYIDAPDTPDDCHPESGKGAGSKSAFRYLRQRPVKDSVEMPSCTRPQAVCVDAAAGFKNGSRDKFERFELLLSLPAFLLSVPFFRSRNRSLFWSTEQFTSSKGTFQKERFYLQCILLLNKLQKERFYTLHTYPMYFTTLKAGHITGFLIFTTCDML